MITESELKVAIVGLGYVGLPLALEFGKHWVTLGYDLNSERIGELKSGFDRTDECSAEELNASSLLELTSEPESLASANFYIVTVPTPIDAENSPDLSAMESASRLLGNHIRAGDIVVFESTVYPGVTEEVCVPIIEEVSGLVFNLDFFAGYSPERINPGDKTHRVSDIVKVTSGSTPEAAEFIDGVYKRVIKAGTYLAKDIKTAEAAKVIENTQRDLNIALVNELSMIFAKMNIDTQEVLDAAATKWNFQRFTPGLVGGHCIGVDPYYLTHKAQAIGHTPEVILAGRKINDAMGVFVVDRLFALSKESDTEGQLSSALVLGIAFKENCPDIRNTKVIDVVCELANRGVDVDVYDPMVDPLEVERLYGITLLKSLPEKLYDCVVLAVPHSELVAVDPARLRTPEGVVFDLKSAWPKSRVNGRL